MPSPTGRRTSFSVTPRAKSSSRRVGVARALSKLGLVSRTIAAQWVRAGRVSVNGRVVRDPESPVRDGQDRLCIDDKPVQAVKKRYVMLNKPRGLVTSARDEQGRDTVYSCFGDKQDQWLAPVGRLDKASEGLLLFTNDTVWADRLLDPASHLAKKYHVQVDDLADEVLLKRLCEGVRIGDRDPMRVSDARLLRSGAKNSWLEITLHEGRNRHIRRLLEALNVRVLRLVRVAVGPVKLGDLAKGRSRALTDGELQAVARALGATTGR